MTIDKSLYSKLRSGNPNIKFLLPESNFTYGMKNKPSTPINDVISKL